MNSAVPVFRFAPSPNGRLHLGHAFSALLNAKFATQLHGRLLVRMEDIDFTRCTQALARLVLEDLSWLGLTWEVPVRVQSEHFDDYAKALDALKTRGLIYPCFCSRKQIAEASKVFDPDGAPIYTGACRQLTSNEIKMRRASGQPHSLRLFMDKALALVPGSLHYQRFNPSSFGMETVDAKPSRWGDAILARKETPTSYHVSVVVDDALQGVTHVVRGEDIEAATCLHVLLQKLLELRTPLYHHHALLTETEGIKLSKSRGSETLEDLRGQGAIAADVRQRLKKFLAEF